MQGIDQGVKVFLLRLPIYVYDSSAFVSFMLNVQVEVAKKQGRVSYISSGEQHLADVLADKAMPSWVNASISAHRSTLQLL